MYKGVPLEWLLFKLYFKMAPLISTFHSRKLVYTWLSCFTPRRSHLDLSETYALEMRNGYVSKV